MITIIIPQHLCIIKQIYIHLYVHIYMYETIQRIINIVIQNVCESTLCLHTLGRSVSLERNAYASDGHLETKMYRTILLCSNFETFGANI